MSPITTHILDTSLGKPAAGVEVVLETGKGDTWNRIGQGVTNADGRVGDLLAEESTPAAGEYRIHFATSAYFRSQGRESFYPGVTVHFEVRDPSEHYHVPLLLNPFGYSTYRGS